MMKMRNQKFFTGLLIIAIVQNHKFVDATRLIGRDSELFGRQENESPQTDPELNLASNLVNLKQPSSNNNNINQQASFVRKQQLFNANNGPDVAPVLHRYPSRHSRSLKQQQTAAAAASQQLFPLLPQFEDEHSMRRHLPASVSLSDLIAQAHTDKSLERALLKMLIDASLRSALQTNVVAPSSSSGWRLEVANGSGGGGETGNGFDLSASGASGAPLARLEQVYDEFSSGVDPSVVSTNDLGGQLASPYQQQDQQYQQASSGSGIGSTSIGKREYIKPCFFNVVACAKNPFRDTS